MAKKLRIDAVDVDKDDGTVTISYTSGSGSVQASAGKTGFAFASLSDLAEAIGELETRISAEDLALMLISVSYKGDPTLADVTASVGKTIYLSLQSGSNIIEVVT
jgi:non-ribosomal peptide synthetase component F